MSESKINQVDDDILHSSLPLTSTKQPSFKIIAIIVAIFLLIAFNYFSFHKQKNKDNVNKEETYNTSYLNPITKNTPNIKETIDKEAIVTANLEKELVEVKAKDFIERLQASQRGNDSNNNTVNNSAISNAQTNNANELSQIKLTDSNTAFLVAANNSKSERSYATHYGNLLYVIGQGKFIFANLSVAINSDLPGQVSAIVSQDIYGEQGRKILIPKGSLLIGEYKSGLQNNQSRLFVVWTRLREPNGIDIMLGSGGTDALGRAGLAGDTNYHFFARFGTASLIAMIGAGASNVGVNGKDQFNSASDYRLQVSGAMAQQATGMLNQSSQIPPTIQIPQGEKIVVFVNKDLDFSGVYK